MKNIKNRKFTSITILFIVIGSGLIAFGLNNSVINKNTINNKIQTKSIGSLSTTFLGHPSSVDANVPDNEFNQLTNDYTLWNTYDGLSKYPTESAQLRGSRLNLLNKKGEFRVDPIFISYDIANKIDEINQKKYEIISNSFYEHSWRGEITEDGNEHYELVVSKPSNWNVNQIGIAWCSLYLSPESISLELGGEWNLNSYQGIGTYSYYNGFRSPTSLYNIGMPMIKYSLIREYVYNLYASNDYYTWKILDSDLHSNQIDRTYPHNPIRNPNDDQSVNPTRSEYPIGNGWDNTWIGANKTEWLNNNVYPYSGYMSPTGEWQDPSWNDIEYVPISPEYQNYKYFKIEITNIILENGIGMYTGSKTHALVMPEIGEIIFNYSIDSISLDPYDYYGANINSPINNSWHQVSPYDTIPLEIGVKGLNLDISNDKSMEQVSFYVDGKEDEKVLMFSKDQNIDIQEPVTSISPSLFWEWKKIKDIWNTSDDGFYLPNGNMYNYIRNKTGYEIDQQDPYLNAVIIPNETKWTSLYDVGVVISDYGDTSQHVMVDKKWEGSDTSVQGDYINYEILDPLKPITDPYTKDGIINYNGNNVKILDHELSAINDNVSKAIYNYKYDDLYYELTAPSLTGPDYSHGWMTYNQSTVPNNGWRVTPNYGLSLSFDYGYINNDIVGLSDISKTILTDFGSIKIPNYVKYNAHTTGDNFLFLSFKFVAHNGKTIDANGISHTALMLISGDSSTADNLSKKNIYQMFLDKKINDEGMIYVDEFSQLPSEEKQTFQINNFENLCDYITESRSLNMFTNDDDYNDWFGIHGYEIKDVKIYSVLNTHRYKLLGEGEGNENYFNDNYNLEDFCPFDRDVVNYKTYFYNDEDGITKWKVYGEVENIESMNDTIYIDNITIINTPKSDNCFTNIYGSIESEKYLNYGPSKNQYELGNDKNPKYWIPFQGNVNNAFEHYNRIKDFYQKDILIKIGSVMLSPNKTYNMKIGLLSSYGYNNDNIKNMKYLSHLWQSKSIIIKKVVLIPKVLHINEIDNFDYASYNNVDPFYSAYYDSSDNTLGKSVIIRNAFSNAYTKGYKKDFRLESTVTTSIYTENPEIGDYVEVTLNFPVTSHYDIYLRDSLLFMHQSDHNRYTVSIDGNIYRRYVQDYDGIIGNSEYQYYQSYVYEMQSYQEELSDYKRSKQLHVASDYFTAGKHTFRITFDQFQDYTYYDTNLQKIITDHDNFSRIRYNQIVMYYKSNSSYEIPISYFQKTNPNFNVHNITTEIVISDDFAQFFGGQKILKYTTSFGIETKPIINFELGTLNDYISKFYGGNIDGDLNQIYQQQYLTNLNGEYNLTAYVYANSLDNNSMKYKINDGPWKLWDNIQSNYGILRKLQSTIKMTEQNIIIGKNIIEITASSTSNDISNAYLAFYYDPNPPEIEILQSSIKEGDKITENGFVNFTLKITDNDGIIDRVAYTTGLKSTWDQNSYRFGRNRWHVSEIPVFDKEIDRKETKSIIINISIPTSEIEQGISTLSFIATDIAKNRKSIEFSINKVTRFMKVNFSKPDWRYVDKDVPIQFNASNYVLEGSDLKYFTSHSLNQKWIQIGYGDSKTIFNKIEHKFIATQESLTKIGFIFQTPMYQLKDFPAMIEIKKGENVLSRGYIYPSSLSISLSLYGGIRYVDIPDTILEVGEYYSIVITPIGFLYNIMNLKIGSFTGNADNIKYQKEMYGESFGYYRGIKIPLNGYIITSIYGKTPIVSQQAGNAYYSINNGILQGPFANGTINTTMPINTQLQGENYLKISVDNGGGYYYYFEKIYRWIEKTYHSPPKTTFISPYLGSNQRGNITIQLQYDYPEYNETYNIQLFIKGDNTQWTWFDNLTIDEFTEKNTIITSLDTNKSISGNIWLNDSSRYEIMAYINDGYDTYRAYSGLFTINNYGPNPQIISPIYNSRWNYNAKFSANVTIYGNSEITKAWVYYNNDPNYRFELISKNMKEIDGEKIYYFEYSIPLDNLKVGANTINFYVEDQYERSGEDSVEIIRDIETFIEVEDKIPSVPNPYEDTVIYYSYFDDYKEISIYMAYSESYGEAGFKKIAKLQKENITGMYSLGILNIGVYKIIINVEDEAGNVWSDDVEFNVIEVGALKSISENISSILSIFGGIFSLGISAKLIKEKNILTSKKISKLCKTSIFSNTKICRR